MPDEILEETQDREEVEPEYVYPDFTDVDENGVLRNFDKVFSKKEPEEPEENQNEPEEPENQNKNNENNATPDEGENPFSLESFESPEKAMEFYTKGIEKPDVKLPIVEPVQQKETPVSAQSQTPEPTFAESAMENINKVVGVMEQAYKTYGDWDTAKQYATQQYQNIIEREQQKQELEDFKNRIEKEKQELFEQKKVVAAKPAFWENITDIVSENHWGNSKNLQSAMFAPEIGGWFMHWMFQKDNPDSKYNSTEEHKQAWEDWLYKFGADKNSLAMAEKITRLSLMANNATKYSKNLAQKEIKKQAEFKKGVSKQTITNKSVSNTKKSGLTPFGGWLQR